MTTCARCGAELAEGVRFCSSCGAAVAQGGLQAPVRKHVVILFCDLVGSTTLGEGADPEALRERLARYFDAVSRVIWSYGGTVEKFIGDAVMAVFGVPDTREDDAVRAVRAAIGIHEAVADLPGLHVRIGVNSGEVFVTHQPDGQFSVTGDAVNTAQRLEAAAGTDETYVGDTVAELVRAHVVLDDVGEVLHKGKTVPQQVFRVAADQDRMVEVREPAFVGREVELADLAALADRAAAREEGWLLTYVGEPGIGKSRLVRQFAAGRGDALRVVVGGADAMSTGAFGPLASWLSGLDPDWEAYVETLLGGDAAAVLHRLRPAVGRSDAQTSIDDVVWAVHTVLAKLSESAPVASVWDDLHWATEAQLDFIGRLATACRNLPVLTICLTRPELFDANPAWGGGRKSRVEDVIPLGEEEMLALAAERIALQDNEIDLTAEDLVARADGNPQVVQLLAQSAAAGEGLPASVTQLYEAALDRLSADERALVEVASVYGRSFPLAPVAATAGLADAGVVVDRLRSRNVLEVTGEGGYRFGQAVFMQTAYRTMPKRTRITRHAALADWLAEHRHEVATDTVPLVASHRRRAYELLQEIDGPPEELASLRESAAASGMHALRAMELRSDPSMPDLLDQVSQLLAPGDARFFRLALSHLVVGTNFMRDRSRWTEVGERIEARMAADPVWQVVGPVLRHHRGMRTGLLTAAEARTEGRAMRERLGGFPDAPANAVQLARLYLSQAEADLGNLTACHALCLEGIAQAHACEDGFFEQVWRNFDIQIGNSGNAPFREVIADTRHVQSMVAANRGLWATTTSVLASALACNGQFDAAWHEWDDLTAALGDDVERLPHVTQYLPRMLSAAGRLADAAHAWAELVDKAQRFSIPTLACGCISGAARDAIFAGDLATARTMRGQAGTIELHDNLSAHRDNAIAFTHAIECALAGDRPGAEAWMDRATGIDRPEESLLEAGYINSLAAIVEHLLGDEAASRTAAEAAKEAFDAKGAVALRDQVDAWVANADRLRTAADAVTG
ncbi:adenylate/guanylate cyclase domain-containing protein [Flexivirga caeni]|uniref:adenylate/guanylate cyclase domain-containing protein n=1 Tax=Flexivirga caeni TaxID=2294115 RepID=UPI0011CDEC16|nr:adenylate/guanylate cyclase domain-containing protein [Flexivirga caeni]